jgi:hypothetical protein
MTMVPNRNDDWLNLYIQGISFRITTPLQSTSAPSSLSTSTLVDGPSAPSYSPPVSAGVVVGTVVGALAFVALSILAVYCFRRRHKKAKNLAPYPTVFTEQVDHEAPQADGLISLTRHATQPANPSSIRPNSSISRGLHDPPPIYGVGDLIGQDSVPLASSFSHELARFAVANRDIINENLEARLQAAGYLPTEDPSQLTPEEWKNEHGITKLELMRLQDLYARYGFKLGCGHLIEPFQQTSKSSATMRSLWGKECTYKSHLPLSSYSTMFVDHAAILFAIPSRAHCSTTYTTPESEIRSLSDTFHTQSSHKPA